MKICIPLWQKLVWEHYSLLKNILSDSFPFLVCLENILKIEVKCLIVGKWLVSQLISCLNMTRWKLYKFNLLFNLLCPSSSVCFEVFPLNKETQYCCPLPFFPPSPLLFPYPLCFIGYYVLHLFYWPSEYALISLLFCRYDYFVVKSYFIFCKTSYLCKHIPPGLSLWFMFTP